MKKSYGIIYTRPGKGVGGWKNACRRVRNPGKPKPKGASEMCLASSIYEMNQQKKAAKTAERRSKETMRNAQAAAAAEKKAEEANAAAEEQVPDTGDTTEISLAKRRRGVASTFLNQKLGE